jgi:hypothetical protein
VKTDSTSQPWIRVGCVGCWPSAVALSISGSGWAEWRTGGVGVGCIGNGIAPGWWGVLVPAVSLAAVLLSAVAGRSGGILGSCGADGALWLSFALEALSSACGVEAAVGELQKLSSVVSIVGACCGMVFALCRGVDPLARGAFGMRGFRRFFRVL